MPGTLNPVLSLFYLKPQALSAHLTAQQGAALGRRVARPYGSGAGAQAQARGPHLHPAGGSRGVQVAAGHTLNTAFAVSGLEHRRGGTTCDGGRQQGHASSKLWLSDFWNDAMVLAVVKRESY